MFETIHTEKTICKKLMFMAGVPEQFIDDTSSYDETLYNIRRMCSLRSLLISKFTEINEAFKVNRSLEGIDEVLNPIRELKAHGISVTEYPSSLSRLIIYLNEDIDRYVKKASNTFAPIPEEWIEEMFKMPDGQDIDGVKNACTKFQKFRNYYPYQRYINWNFAATPEEKRSKNVLKDDETFMALLADMHASSACRLFDFIGTRENVVVVVDCENSDAQRLYNSLQPVLPSINKIILINDEHTNALWKELTNQLTEMHVNIEHIQIGRLKTEKSLTDLKMVAKTCEEYYQNNIRNFVFASSDSDMWALIASLPEADIMVLAEQCKSGDVLIDALTQNGIPYAFMEDVQTDSTELMDKVVADEIKYQLRKKPIEGRKVMLNVTGKLNLYPSDEKFQQYIAEADKWCQIIHGATKNVTDELTAVNE